MRVRVTAAVDRRSSWKMKGRGVRGAQLRMKAWVDWARGPSLPSMFSGRPMTKATTSCFFASSTMRATSLVNLVRWMVSSGVAMRRSTSDRARPMVLVPRSRPISLP